MLGKAFLGAAFLAVALVLPVRTPAQTTAQTIPSPSPAPSPTATPVPPWTFTGFDDVTYTTPLAQGGTFVFINGVPNRVFDGITSGIPYQAAGSTSCCPAQMTRFVGNNFNFDLKKNTTQGIGGNLEISLGSDANVIASYGGAGGTFTDITQANLYYATGPFTLTAGKFETLAGYEVIESPSDTQISRSILFGYAVPFTHTGLRLAWAPSSKFAVTAGVNYGWDQIVSTNGLSTLEGGLGWTPSSQFAFHANYYNGKEPSPLTPYPTSPATIYGTRWLVDLVANWTPSGAMSFGANFDTASQGNSQSFTNAGAVVTNAAGIPVLGVDSWNGLAGYANWNMTPHFTLSGRVETFKDNQGARTGIAQTWDEGTLMLQFNPQFSNVKLRAEFRTDWSNTPSFARNTLPIGSAASNNSSFGLEAIYTWP